MKNKRKRTRSIQIGKFIIIYHRCYEAKRGDRDLKRFAIFWSCLPGILTFSSRILEKTNLLGDVGIWICRQDKIRMPSDVTNQHFC